jgi:anti-sigma factor RsiW
MQCEEVRVQLAEYLAVRLSNPIQADLEAHLAACPQCQEECNQLDELLVDLRAIPEEDIDSAAMTERFQTFLNTERNGVGSRPATTSHFWPRTRPFQVALIMLLLAAAVFAAQRSRVWEVVNAMAPRNHVAARMSTEMQVRAGGTLSGEVRTLVGVPASGVWVSALPVSGSGGSGTAAPVRTGQTDDAGRYRFVDIPPGRYNIVAGAPEAPTYSPGMIDVADARVVSVTAGSAVGGIDVTLAPRPAAQTRQEQDTKIRAAIAASPGFRSAISSGAIPPPAGSGWISGRVVVDGAHEWPDPRFLVTMNYTSANMSGVSRSTVNADGTFRFQVGVQAPVLPEIEVRFGILGRDGDALPEDYYVKSISGGVMDLLRQPLKFVGPTVPDVQIEIGAGQRVTGNVRGETGQPATNITVNLLPRLEEDRDRLKRSAITDQNGDFVIRKVAPGEYILMGAPNGSPLPVSVLAENTPAINLILSADQTLIPSGVPIR